MAIYLGLIMFICIVPTLLICYVIMYPKNWKNKKLIFGIKNRDAYHEGEAKEAIDRIVGKYRRMAGMIVVGGCAIAVILLLLNKIPFAITTWTVFVMLAVFGINIPYVLGNKELKMLKRSLGIGNETRVNLVDLSNAGAVHALNKNRLIVPMAVGGVVFVLTLLVDLQVIPAPESWIVGTFALTSINLIMWLMGAMMSGFAVVMDRMKNEVISTDSTINANYNRAKKKNAADMFVRFVWFNTIFGAVMMSSFLFADSDMFVLAVFGGYMLFFMLALAAYVKKSKMIESRYEKDMQVLADDDDYWIGGMLYYNPKDSRLNVEKRNGVGGTVNMAHPVGKGISLIVGLAMIIVVLALVWISMLEATPMKLLVDQDKVICHHLRDEYVIELKDIQSVEWGEDIDDLKLYRTFGIGTITLNKGDFTVNDEKRCKVFMNTDLVHYIKIITADRTYYINGGTPEEMENTYRMIQENMK